MDADTKERVTHPEKRDSEKRVWERMVRVWLKSIFLSHLMCLRFWD